MKAYAVKSTTQTQTSCDIWPHSYGLFCFWVDSHCSCNEIAKKYNYYDGCIVARGRLCYRVWLGLMQCLCLFPYRIKGSVCVCVYAREFVCVEHTSSRIHTQNSDAHKLTDIHISAWWEAERLYIWTSIRKEQKKCFESIYWLDVVCFHCLFRIRVNGRTKWIWMAMRFIAD